MTDARDCPTRTISLCSRRRRRRRRLAVAGIRLTGWQHRTAVTVVLQSQVSDSPGGNTGPPSSCSRRYPTHRVATPDRRRRRLAVAGIRLTGWQHRTAATVVLQSQVSDSPGGNTGPPPSCLDSSRCYAAHSRSNRLGRAGRPRVPGKKIKNNSTDFADFGLRIAEKCVWRPRSARTRYSAPTDPLAVITGLSLIHI